MADLRITKIKLRNWMKFRQVNISLPQKGLVLVQGANAASGGALSSVGAGKTAFGESLCRALLGVPGRFQSAKQCSHEKQGDMYVRVEGELHGKPLIVESGYACDELSGSSGEGLRYSYDGKVVERGRFQQTREDLTRLIGVPQLLAEWTAFMDGEKLKFNRLTQGDCVDLVMSALRQPPWHEFYEAAKLKSRDLRIAVAKDEAEHVAALKEVTTATEDMDDAKTCLDEAKSAFSAAVRRQKESVATKKNEREASVKSLSETRAEMTKIKADIKLMESERAAESHKIETKIRAKEDILDGRAVERVKLNHDRDVRFAANLKASTAYENYRKSSGKCPTCLRPMATLDESRLAQLKIASETASAELAEADARLNDYDKVTADIQRERNTLSKAHRDISAVTRVKSLSSRYQLLESTVESLTDAVSDCDVALARMEKGPSDSEVIKAESTLRTCKQRLALCQDRLDKSAVTLRENSNMAKIIDYWYHAYSPYGIPNMILREVMGPLNHEARRISAALTGGTIDVRFSTIKESSSGKEKAQLNIEVDNKLGDKDLAGNSKGESGLANFIIAETLSEVGQVSRRLGFRWYDEILPHQDPKVCQSIYKYMKSEAERLGILIFLVDHNPVAANYADHVLLVTKEHVTPVDGDDENAEGVCSRVSWSNSRS